MELEEYLVINIHGDNMAKFECNPPNFFFFLVGFSCGSGVKNPLVNVGECKFDPWVGKIP